MNARYLMIIDRREWPEFWRDVRQRFYADRFNRRLKLRLISFRRRTTTINNKQK